MKFPQIGELLPNGHIVDAAYCVGEDRYVLAHRDGAPEPYVVWSVDQDGDTRNGSYFTDPVRAQRCFAKRCYDWQGELNKNNRTSCLVTLHGICFHGKLYDFRDSLMHIGYRVEVEDRCGAVIIHLPFDKETEAELVVR